MPDPTDRSSRVTTWVSQTIGEATRAQASPWTQTLLELQRTIAANESARRLQRAYVRGAVLTAALFGLLLLEVWAWVVISTG